MKRFVIVLVLLSIGAVGLYYFNQLWMHRYDVFIQRQANVYRIDPDLVWSVIYEETYFRPWKIGGDDRAYAPVAFWNHLKRHN